MQVLIRSARSLFLAINCSFHTLNFKSKLSNRAELIYKINLTQVVVCQRFKGLPTANFKLLTYLNAEDVWNLAEIADCYNELGNYDKAIEYQHRIVELEPENASRWATLGFYYSKKKEFNTALEYHFKAQQLNKEYVWNLARIAKCYFKLNDYNLAIHYQQEAAALEPEDSGNWEQLGLYYLLSNQKEKADFYFDKALELDFLKKEKDPNNPAIYGSLGWTYFLKEDFNKAKEFFEMQIQLESEKVSYHPFGNLGHIALINQNIEESKKFNQRAMEIAIQNNELENLWNGLEEDLVLLERQGITQTAYWNLLNGIKADLEANEADA